ncbi:hypothetical protein BJ912DRAFT_676624 [Pholiota molesta]|nr:hypothetical protein BJ912DRAFT_676624 [Pholiota molesta]
MLSLRLLLRPRLYRSFPQLNSPELNPWCLMPCARMKILEKRMLATSTEKIPHKALRISFRLRTLRPELLSIVGQEVIDLSGKAHSLVPILINGRVLRLNCEYEDRVLGGLYRLPPFPENTRGFFYYYHPPDGPEFYAGVRFRICDSAAEFEHGRDLLDPRGDVWGPKILALVKNKECEGFLSLLRAENMIDEGLVRDIHKLDNSRNMRKSQYSLFEPFHLNVAQSKRVSTYVTRAKVIRLCFPQKIFGVQTNNRVSFPLTGTIKVQFELSDLPEHKELGPTLVIRVLDIVEPIALDPLYYGKTIPPIPVPGTLLHRTAHGGSGKRKIRVLYIPLKDEPMADDLLELMKSSSLSPDTIKPSAHQLLA